MTAPGGVVRSRSTGGRLMKWILIGLAALVVLIAIVALIGLLIPKQHRASSSARFKATAEQIWAAISDFESMPSWRPGLKVERLPDRNGHPVWLETSKQGKMPLELVEVVAPRRMVGRIADPNLPFGGTWTYEIEPADGGARLTITEDGEIYNPIFRTMARFVFGYHATLEGYLRALGRKFGEQVEPARREP